MRLGRCRWRRDDAAVGPRSRFGRQQQGSQKEPKSWLFYQGTKYPTLAAHPGHDGGALCVILFAPWYHTNGPNDRLLGGALTPVMPTKVGIHDFAVASKQVVDGGPSPAMTRGKALMGQSFGRLVSDSRPRCGAITIGPAARASPRFSTTKVRRHEGSAPPTRRIVVGRQAHWPISRASWLRTFVVENPVPRTARAAPVAADCQCRSLDKFPYDTYTRRRKG